MRADWLALVERIGRRDIDAAHSDLAHRLLIEQTVQVQDLLVDGAGLPLSHDANDGGLRLAREAIVQPARMANWVIELDGLEAPSRQAPQPAGADGARAGELRRRLLQASTAPRPTAVRAGAEPGTTSAERAVWAVEAAAADARAALRERLDGGPQPATRERVAAALNAWSAAGEVALAEAVAHRVQGLREQRLRLVVLTGLVATLALLAAAALLAAPTRGRPGPRRWLRSDAAQAPLPAAAEPVVPGPAAEGSAAAEPGALAPQGAESRRPAEALIDRLRQAEPNPPEPAPERPPGG
jgi:hypothetical protein